MNIIKTKNREGSFDFNFIDKDKRLKIMFAGNLDLYFVLSINRAIRLEDIDIIFDVTKADYELFSAIDSMYREVISGQVFPDSNYKGSSAYNYLVDKDENITWISDDGPAELEDKMTIKKLDDDSYRFIFSRNSKPLDFGFKGSGICVRIRNSGSSYSPFNCSFMKMYRNIQAIDPDYHQIHIEEYEYQKRIGALHE